MKNKIRLLALAMASLIAVGSAVPQTAAGAAVKTDSASGTAAKPASSSSFMDILLHGMDISIPRTFPRPV